MVQSTKNIFEDYADLGKKVTKTQVMPEQHRIM